MRWPHAWELIRRHDQPPPLFWPDSCWRHFLAGWRGSPARRSARTMSSCVLAGQCHLVDLAGRRPSNRRAVPRSLCGRNQPVPQSCCQSSCLGRPPRAGSGRAPRAGLRAARAFVLRARSRSGETVSTDVAGSVSMSCRDPSRPGCCCPRACRELAAGARQACTLLSAPDPRSSGSPPP